jgi:phosphoribosylformylglycinamidine (FGAM) synthase-like enzyme
VTDAPSPVRPSLDTVARASSTPDQAQPWAELGLKPDEYDSIRAILGRRPTGAELAMYSVMWSEHCSYKSSKVHLKKFGELPQETPLGKTLAGIGENAGVIDIGQGYAVTFKVESHIRELRRASAASSATSSRWERVPSP